MSRFLPFITPFLPTKNRIDLEALFCMPRPLVAPTPSPRRKSEIWGLCVPSVCSFSVRREAPEGQRLTLNGRFYRTFCYQVSSHANGRSSGVQNSTFSKVVLIPFPLCESCRMCPLEARQFFPREWLQFSSPTMATCSLTME